MGAVPPPCAPTVPEHKQLWRHGRPHEPVTPGRVTSAATTSFCSSSATAAEAPLPLPVTAALHMVGQEQWQVFGAVPVCETGRHGRPVVWLACNSITESHDLQPPPCPLSLLPLLVCHCRRSTLAPSCHFCHTCGGPGAAGTWGYCPCTSGCGDQVVRGAGAGAGARGCAGGR